MSIPNSSSGLQGCRFHRHLAAAFLLIAMRGAALSAAENERSPAGMLHANGAILRDDGRFIDVPPKPGFLAEEYGLAKPDALAEELTKRYPLLTGMSLTPRPRDRAHVEPTIPMELREEVEEANHQMALGHYREAEEIYEGLVAKEPTNLYFLSNLGVIQFRMGKLKDAEQSFRAAIIFAPEDGFSHSVLGLVYYTRGKYDEAVSELTKALAINPKDAVAHNYLGITASQKGWQEPARKELESAIAFDPAYADAYYNLAVVLVTYRPPEKERARQCYKKALELGADRDATLEQWLGPDNSRP